MTVDKYQNLPLSAFPLATSEVLAGRDFMFDAHQALPSDALVERARFGELGTQAVVIMPVRVGREITGFAGFASLRPRHWSAETLSSMRLTVEILASAMDRRTREEAIQDRMQFEVLLADLSRGFINAPLSDGDAVIRDALRVMGTALGFERAVVYLRDAQGESLNSAHEWRVDSMPSADPEFRQSAPLISSGENFGTLALYSRHKNKLGADFVNRLTLVGEWVASAVSRVGAERARDAAYRELQALKSKIEGERDYLREEIRNVHDGGAIIGQSEAIRTTLAAIAAVAPTQASVLIRGESGVGKELIARAIHDASTRADGPLVRVNCASIPRELFESEFFGHVRGAFTNAHKDRAGRFELASGGTLFLDEVADIPYDLQAKLLRVLQEGEFERVGDERTKKTDVRIVAATNRDLEADIAAGRFRRDLYYRLCTFPIEAPPLRDRGDDVVLLARHFLEVYKRINGKSSLVLSDENQRALLAYPWPGNVRELQHVIERAAILSSAGTLRLDLALPNAGPAPMTMSARESGPLPMAQLKELQRQNIVAALDQTHWRVAGAGGAASLLGIKPSTLRDRMRVLGIARR